MDSGADSGKRPGDAFLTVDAEQWAAFVRMRARLM